MAAKKKIPIDWEAVSMRYRAGTESLRNIAAHYSITEGAIRAKAKVEGWERDLKEKVRLATEALLIKQSSTHDLRTEQQTIAVEAQMRANVVLGHRKGLKRLGGLRDKLISEIEMVTDHAEVFDKLGEIMDESGPDANGNWKPDKLNALYRKVISVSGRIDDAKKLSEIDEKVRKGEREAFNIGGEEESKGNVEELLAKIGLKIKGHG